MLLLAVAMATVAPFVGGALLFGTPELRFEVTNTSQAHWGCLTGIFLGGDPQPTNNGVLQAAGLGATQVWRLTATACNVSFPAATLSMDSCTASCARKYLVKPQHTRASSTSTSTSTSSVHMRWEGCTACPDGPGSAGCNYTLANASGLPATLDIDVTVDVVGGRSTWRGSVGKQNAGGLCLQSFALPSIESLRFGPEDEMFVPYQFGAKGNRSDFDWGEITPEIAAVRGVGDPNGDNAEHSWMPNGFERTMQWAAWLSRSVGLYLGVHDPASRLKMLAARPFGYKASAVLRAVHVPDSFGDNSTATFTIPYEVVVAAVPRGEWWEAAQMYRGWATAHAHWTRRGNLSARSDVPAWLLRAPVWVRLNSLAPSHSSTLQLVDGIREHFGGPGSEVADIGLHWYSWNTEAFDSHYPIYTAKPGFGAAVARLQTPHAGITARVVPYTNGRIWDPAGPLAKSQVPVAAVCKGRNGTAYHEVYGSKVPFTVMDPASAFMQDEWSTAVGNITAKYVQADVQAICPY